MALRRGDYPGWNDFLTFSTGFSTAFVKKKRVFPHCFPLFPPSFPQKIAHEVIRVVFRDAEEKQNRREKSTKHLFSKSRSNIKIYFMRLIPEDGKYAFPAGKFLQRSFPQIHPPKIPMWKTVGKPGFSTFFVPDVKKALLLPYKGAEAP